MSEPRTTRHLGIGGITCLLILLVTLVSPATVSARPSPDETSASEGSTGTSDSSRLLQKAQREGSVRAIVGLRTDFDARRAAEPAPGRRSEGSYRERGGGAAGGPGRHRLPDAARVRDGPLRRAQVDPRGVPGGPGLPDRDHDTRRRRRSAGPGREQHHRSGPDHVGEQPHRSRRDHRGARYRRGPLPSVPGRQGRGGSLLLAKLQLSERPEDPDGDGLGGSLHVCREGVPARDPRRRDRRRAGERLLRRGAERQHHVGPGLLPGYGVGLQKRRRGSLPGDFCQRRRWRVWSGSTN